MRTIVLYDMSGPMSILNLPAHASRTEALRIARSALSLATERGWGVEYTSDEPLLVARAFVAELRSGRAHTTHTAPQIAANA